MTEIIWQAKLDARLHDPAEKALILMRTEHGHEGGTSRALRAEMGLAELPAAVKQAVRLGDHWASAADRAAYPKHEKDGRYPAWQNVQFTKRPVMVHPLTGAELDLTTLDDDIPVEEVEALSLAHHRGLIHEGDLRATALAFWRFGPELDGSDLDSLWRVLPADTRVPDHSIWDHLDLTSAFAGAFADDPDGGPALLAVSLGPVQEMIAAARSTSDLWAGSHLLSRLSWEAMKVVCEALGPDAILFPRLRGVPQVDLWLRNECNLRPELFEGASWTKTDTDANPLFAAALPNRFTALVSARQARELGEEITRRVQAWVVDHADQALRELLDVAGIEDTPELPAYAQIREQLAGFPEVHWTSVAWSLAAEARDDGKVFASDKALAAAMQPFFASSPPGYLRSAAWQLLSGGFLLEDGWSWRPNPGALYPALHELLERTLAAAKSTRSFSQTSQHGWRDSLTGESERLTTDRSSLSRREDALWKAVAQERKSWVRPGEQLGALGTLKRMWPTLFVRELEDALQRSFPRFVVSTHTMALASSLSRWVAKGESLPMELTDTVRKSSVRVALPRKLAAALRAAPDADALRLLPGWFEQERESADEQRIRSANRAMKKLFGHTPEAYYSLVLMDGDRMGAWLSADREFTLPHERSFHPQIRSAASNRFGGDKNFVAYAESLRGASPSRHMAISEALNNFSLTLAPAVVERQFHGRVLYAGGDDLMAMLPVSELLPAMASLRAVYSGISSSSVGGQKDDGGYAQQANGFVRHGRQVLRVMGEAATASIGAVIAHHQTPLNLVLRELKSAEQRAKDGGRNAFAISVLKRSGGALHLVCQWARDEDDPPMACLRALSAALAGDEASRRAAYNVQAWSADLPEPSQFADANSYRTMLRQLLAYQLDRQGLENAATHASHLAQMAPVDSRANALGFINNFLSVAEFLAREGRGN